MRTATAVCNRCNLTFDKWDIHPETGLCPTCEEEPPQLEWENEDGTADLVHGS
jgi:hypothetical protein